MRILLALTIATALIFSFGCSDSNPSATNNESLNFDILGDDVPESVEAGIAELAEFEITVLDPVTEQDMAALGTLDEESDLRDADNATLEEGDRPNFRRIIRHLHHRLGGLRECLAENDDPQLRRVVHGAMQATHRGMHALRNGHPRYALRAFHRANRLLNLAYRICRGEDSGEGGDRG